MAKADKSTFTSKQMEFIARKLGVSAEEIQSIEFITKNEAIKKCLCRDGSYDTKCCKKPD